MLYPRDITYCAPKHSLPKITTTKQLQNNFLNTKHQLTSVLFTEHYKLSIGVFVIAILVLTWRDLIREDPRSASSVTAQWGYQSIFYGMLHVSQSLSAVFWRYVSLAQIHASVTIWDVFSYIYLGVCMRESISIWTILQLFKNIIKIHCSRND